MQNIGIVVDNEFNHDVRVVNECRILAENGLNVFILCFNYGKYNNQETIFGCEVSRIPISRKIRNILFAFNNSIELYNLFWKYHIKRFIKKFNIDVLHVHDLYMSKPAFYATKKPAIHFNLDLHENYPAAVKGYKWMYKLPFRYFINASKWEKLEQKYLNYTEKIIVLSETFRDNLINKYSFLNQEKFVVYPNVPDLDELTGYKIDNSILSKNNGLILFYFGVISERRGIYTVINSLKDLKSKIPNLKLLLIGPADKAEQNTFNETINDPEIKDMIIYYPWKDISLLPSYIKISDICLSPIIKNDQHESGVANKIFQYMLFEKPLIVSNCKPQEKIINEENCGLVFKSNNSNDLSEKILQLYDDEDLRKKMGVNGRNAVEKKYNTQIAGKNLVNLYTKI
ncbi:MAG: glycosyltransferase family 4 protein [Bacteroidales bacterium]|nr:glycosyltransferase family 4 protein [Bacteroidales bacterium]